MVRPLVALLMALALGVAACVDTGLPGGVRAALTTYWDSLPTDARIDHRITRAWQGATDLELPEGELPPVDIWCVETETSAADDPSVDGTRLVWIVTRRTGEVGWTPAMLATLSSTWPSEACAPGHADS